MNLIEVIDPKPFLPVIDSYQVFTKLFGRVNLGAVYDREVNLFADIINCDRGVDSFKSMCFSPLSAYATCSITGI